MSNSFATYWLAAAGDGSNNADSAKQITVAEEPVALETSSPRSSPTTGNPHAKLGPILSERENTL